MLESPTNEQYPLSEEGINLLSVLFCVPFACIKDTVVLSGMKDGTVRHTIVELITAGLVTSHPLGWTKALMNRFWLTRDALKLKGATGASWHDDGNLSYLLQRLPLIEHFYPAVGAARNLGSFREFQWISGRSMDAIACFKEGWVALCWSGITEKESHISARMESLGLDLLELAASEETPFPAKIIFLVEDWWQQVLVLRATRYLPMAETLVSTWCINDGPCPNIIATPESRGMVHQEVGARGTGAWT